MLQQIAVALAVALAGGFSTWTLMPATWRTALRRRVGLAAPAEAGGCGGCGGGCAPSTASGAARPAVAVVTVHRRTGADRRAT
jgi:hypothetical protein